MLQRKRCVPFRRATYVGGGIKMRPSNELRLLRPIDLVSGFNLRQRGRAPQADYTIGTTAGGQSSAVGREFDKTGPHACFESNDLATRGQIPQLASITANAGEGLAIRGKSQLQGPVFLAGKSRQFLLPG